MVTALLFISILLTSNFISYAVGRKGGLPDSISAIVFDLKHPWAWSIWLWAVTFTLAPALLDAMPNDYQVFAFGFLACMLFTGICPLFDTGKRRWHYPLAFIGGVFSQVCVWYICPWWLFLWLALIAFVGIALKWVCSKVVILMEMTCYLGIIGAIMFH